jgi:LuxR family transcriptional regulator of csgAB operon
MLVSSRRFSVEMLANFITNNTPAKWSIVAKMRDVPRLVNAKENSWRLIFIDCMGLASKDVIELIKTEAAPFLQSDIVALFNLPRGLLNFPELIDLGVRGFFFENDEAEFLLRGICALKSGELWVNRGTLMEYVYQYPRKTPSENAVADLLTTREKDVLILLASGATNEVIADRLFISPYTVKTHIHNTLKKLGLQNRLQAALWSAKHLG